MTQSTAEATLALASTWWDTQIIDIHPGQIAVRGYEIQDLIGNVRFPEMIWLMLRGELPTRAQGELLEHALVAAVDHGPQAPSIAVSRMAVTCGLPVNGAMASAVNVLDDVHGGAGQQCMEFYREVCAELAATRTDGAGNSDVSAEAAATLDPEPDHDRLLAAVETVLTRWRAAGVRHVPGFGHRFHPIDPRAPRLLELVDAAVAAGTVRGRFAAIGRALEEVLARGRAKPIPMNIDGVTAVIYCELGFEPQLGRGIFILSRSVGILAHAWEQTRQGGRIKGPMPREIPYRYSGPAHREVPVVGAAAG